MPRSLRADYPHRRGALRREIIGLLCLKLAALSILYWAFFGPAVRPHLSTPDLTAHILATGAAHLD